MIYRIAIWDFIDAYIERRYLLACKIARLTYGFIKPTQPIYYWNGGFYD